MHWLRTGEEIRPAGGLRCGRCARELRASDFDGDFDFDNGRLRIRAVCQGCHQDVLTIERSF
jgi:hypothetical protein